MKDAALGFRTHSGWTALVALCLERNQPRVLARARPKLVKEFTYEFRQPYHTAEKMPVDAISLIESAATRLAEEAIRKIQVDPETGVQTHVSRFASCIRATAPKPGEGSALSCTSTYGGWRTLSSGCDLPQQCQIAAFTLAERELVTVACATLKTSKDDLLGRLVALGRSIGPPWSQDEKIATMAAWLALLHAVSRSTKPGNG